MITRRAVTLAALISVVHAAPASSAAQNPPAPQLDEQLQELSERLALTAPQREAARPVVERSMGQRRAVLDSHGVRLGDDSFEALSMREKRQVLKELREVGEQADAAWREILSDQQYAQYQSIKDEARQRARARIFDSRMDSGR